MLETLDEIWETVQQEPFILCGDLNAKVVAEPNNKGNILIEWMEGRNIDINEPTTRGYCKCTMEFYTY
jgi:hypothetical protein